MADIPNPVESHYSSVALGEKIFAALKAEGIDVEHLTPGMLAPLDQVHTRGWSSTVEHVQMKLNDALVESYTSFIDAKHPGDSGVL